MEIALLVIIALLFAAIAWRLWKPPMPIEKKEDPAIVAPPPKPNERAHADARRQARRVGKGDQRFHE